MGPSWIARFENVPFSRWHARARVIMGSATFFDAYNALSLAFALPILIRLWHISPTQVGLLIGAGYVGQLAGALPAVRLGGGEIRTHPQRDGRRRDYVAP